MLSHISVIYTQSGMHVGASVQTITTVPLFHKSFFPWLFVMTRTPLLIPE